MSYLSDSKASEQAHVQRPADRAGVAAAVFTVYVRLPQEGEPANDGYGSRGRGRDTGGLTTAIVYLGGGGVHGYDDRHTRCPECRAIHQELQQEFATAKCAYLI